MRIKGDIRISVVVVDFLIKRERMRVWLISSIDSIFRIQYITTMHCIIKHRIQNNKKYCTHHQFLPHQDRLLASK